MAGQWQHFWCCDVTFWAMTKKQQNWGGDWDWLEIVDFISIAINSSLILLHFLSGKYTVKQQSGKAPFDIQMDICRPKLERKISEVVASVNIEKTTLTFWKTCTTSSPTHCTCTIFEWSAIQVTPMGRTMYFLNMWNIPCSDWLPKRADWHVSQCRFFARFCLPQWHLWGTKCTHDGHATSIEVHCQCHWNITEE